MNFFTRRNSVLSGFALIVIGIFGYLKYQATRFDQSRWRRSPYTGEFDRTGMVKDLVITQDLKRKTRPEVRLLLGQPEKYSDTKPNEDWYLLKMIWVGLEPRVIVHLVLRYDPETGKVLECGIKHYEKYGPTSYTPL